MQRVVSVEVYVFWGVLKGRHCNSFMVFIPSSITRCDVERRVEEDADPCLPFNVHLYMGLYRYYKGNFKTGTEVLSIVLHTSSSNTRSCLVCRLKGKTLLLPYL